MNLLTQSFSRAGFPLYLVGGSVRDRLLGKTPKDLDYTTSGRPDEITGVLRSLDLPVYPIGEKFGTISTLVDGKSIEITTFRSDHYTEGSRHPEVTFGLSLQEDLARRDFTINAMAMGAEDTLIDPFHGQHDLKHGLIRAVGDPEQRFREDPLRMLRALRFASTLDLWVEQLTFFEIRQRFSLLAMISRERVRDELSKLLLGPGVGRVLEQLVVTGLLSQICPDLARLPGCMDSTKVSDRNPDGDVWEHTTQVVAGIAPTLPLRLAALYHDVGKSVTRTVEGDGTTHFFRHEWLGQEMTSIALRRLHFDQATVQQVSHLVVHHMLRINFRAGGTERSLRRFVHQVSPENLENLFALFRADMRAGSATPEEYVLLDQFQQRCQKVKEVLVVKSPLDGNELMAHYERSAGPWIKELKKSLEQAVLDGTLDLEDKVGAYRLVDTISD